MYIKIEPAPLPDVTWLRKISPIDYSDTFIAEWISERYFSSEEMLIAVFCLTPPTWLKLLYRIRNSLVKLFHVTENINKKGGDFANSIREGKPFGIFTIPFKSMPETVLLGQDGHLDFYLSLQTGVNSSDKRRMAATTVVHFKNMAGRIYFFFICPFHRFIVPAMMKKAILELERGKETEAF